MVAKPSLQHDRRAKRPAPTILELRLRDLSCLRAGRYGEAMPDTPDTRRLVTIIAQHMAAMPYSKPLQTIPSWISLYAPWCSPAQAATIIADTLNAPKFWKAHELAWALKLTAADRKALRITTIGACDMSPQQRAKQRKLMKRLEREEKRRAKGAIPRDQYLAKERAKPKPWLTQGISRRTWYRRRA
jgi:hypothetical protein